MERLIPEPVHDLVVIGAPSSAGAYAPGQEKAPAALRSAGLIERMRAGGHRVEDAGDVPGFRWSADVAHARAMNAAIVQRVAQDTASRVRKTIERGRKALVLGGDCTVELGTVAGCLAITESVGLVYVDLDTDLNTPTSTTDGALDWMGMAHMLALPDTVDGLTTLAGRAPPMLRPEQVLFFGSGNVEPFERQVINDLNIAEYSLQRVAADPTSAGRAAANEWGSRFERLLVHLDVDVLDFLDMPLAENNRRNIGLKFTELMAALTPLLAAPNWSALTICEINPDHGQADGATLRRFVNALADALPR